jgi:hypothetical protein
MLRVLKPEERDHIFLRNISKNLPFRHGGKPRNTLESVWIDVEPQASGCFDEKKNNGFRKSYVMRLVSLYGFVAFKVAAVRGGIF